MKRPDNTGVGEDEEEIELSYGAGESTVSVVGSCWQHPLKLKIAHILRPSSSAFTYITRKDSHICAPRGMYGVTEYYL